MNPERRKFIESLVIRVVVLVLTALLPGCYFRWIAGLLKLLGEEGHDPGLDHPEWVDQPLPFLKGRYFRQIHAQQEMQQHLQTHLALNESPPVLL